VTGKRNRNRGRNKNRNKNGRRTENPDSRPGNTGPSNPMMISGLSIVVRSRNRRCGFYRHHVSGHARRAAACVHMLSARSTVPAGRSAAGVRADARSNRGADRAARRSRRRRLADRASPQPLSPGGPDGETPLWAAQPWHTEPKRHSQCPARRPRPGPDLDLTAARRPTASSAIDPIPSDPPRTIASNRNCPDRTAPRYQRPNCRVRSRTSAKPHRLFACRASGIQASWITLWSEHALSLKAKEYPRCPTSPDGGS
jgi:hypothetical protein